MPASSSARSAGSLARPMRTSPPAERSRRTAHTTAATPEESRNVVWPRSSVTLRVPPQDLWPLRMLGGLFLTLAPLGVTADWPALVREAAQTGWAV